jgi:hypothetical protein
MSSKYSGRNSVKFWDRIGKLDKRHDELYILGVVLQNLEDFTLKQLDLAELEQRVSKYDKLPTYKRTKNKKTNTIGLKRCKK